MRFQSVTGKLGFSGRAFFICIAIGVTLSLLAGEKAPDSYVKLMKSAGAAAGSLRKDSEAKDYSGVAKDAATFRSIYSDAKTFWDARNVETASSALSAGAKAVADLQAAAEGKNDEGITAASQALMRSCGACHSAHREKVADGYEIK